VTSREPVARNTKVKGKKEPPELAKRLAEKQTGENPTMSIILTAASVFPASPTARCHVNKNKKRKKVTARSTEPIVDKTAAARIANSSPVRSIA